MPTFATKKTQKSIKSPQTQKVQNESKRKTPFRFENYPPANPVLMLAFKTKMGQTCIRCLKDKTNQNEKHFFVLKLHANPVAMLAFKTKISKRKRAFVLKFFRQLTRFRCWSTGENFQNERVTS